jgi:hypothetical protein
LAAAFDEEIGLVSYHLNQVLAREAGMVELVDRVARRGAVEKIYALDPAIWAALAESSELADGENIMLPLEVDSAALVEILDAQREFRARVEAARKQAQVRNAQSPSAPRRVVVGSAIFSL